MYSLYALSAATSRWNWMGLHLNVERVLALENHPLLEGDDKKTQRLQQIAKRLRASLIESEGGLPACGQPCELTYTLTAVPGQIGQPSPRWRSKGSVNLHTIPWRAPGSKLVGGCISPPRGYTWFTVGWKRPDIWAVANLTRHPGFLEFATADDPHEWLADKVGIPEDHRSDLRRAVLSTLYNPTGENQAQWTPKEYPYLNAIGEVLFHPTERVRLALGEGYPNPYPRDPFRRKLPHRYQYPLAFQRLLVDMALVEVWQHHRNCANLALMLPKTMLWEVRDEYADEFEEDMHHRLIFQEISLRMEWPLAPEPKVTRVRDLSDYFGG